MNNRHRPVKPYMGATLEPHPGVFFARAGIMVNWPKWVLAVAFCRRRWVGVPTTLPANARLDVNRGETRKRREKDEKSLRPLRFNLPSVSIIVPARNEAANLPRLLPSLGRLEYPGPVEMIVVDDNSVDETAVMTQNAGVKLIQLDHLPEGWLGKPHACHHGAAEASGDWLLFTDADTEHTPDGLARAMQYALDHELDGLTFHLGHITNGWLDSVTLLAAFAGLFAGPPKACFDERLIHFAAARCVSK
ncbi:MAG: glycosyltransferase family 2 protein [Ardenticatenaceae bacterium]|nr:glycosyltransferase family 2 protein [Ardenticatenaceae bacterium]